MRIEQSNMEGFVQWNWKSLDIPLTAGSKSMMDRYCAAVC